MKILVTSGGTSEAIDRVRSITNHSTGRLGKVITETLLKAGHQVCLITTQQASQDLNEFLHKKNMESKISSKDEVQVLFLKKNPKIISLVKEWNPSIHLIGFKLLVDVTKEHLIQIARESLVKNQADLIVANDLTQINENQHLAYLVEEKAYQLSTSKQDIADLLTKRIQELDR